MAGIFPDRMMPNLASSSVSTHNFIHLLKKQHNTTAIEYGPLDDVAFLQIAVLQQDLLERDVEETRKRKRRRRPKRCQTRLWLAEERRRLYGHYARLMEGLTD